MKLLLKNLFKTRSVARLPAALPENHRLYCIGDIHGSVDLLRKVHQKITDDVKDFNGLKTLVYLGDYIDRGINPKETINCLLENPFPDFKKIFLRGNHEQFLLTFINNDDPQIGLNWLEFGGFSTLVSYGVKLYGIPLARDIPQICIEFKQKLPASHLEFLENLSFTYELGDYFFVHAGVKPKVELNSQQPQDLISIREEFLTSQLFHGKVIVHGHTISTEPEYLPNRIGIDTGAYFSGKLSCAVFEADQCRFL